MNLIQERHRHWRHHRLAQVARLLRPGEPVRRTIDLAPSASDLLLPTSRRSAHGAGYILRLAQHSGFEISATAEHPIREDQGVPIPGLFA